MKSEESIRARLQRIEESLEEDFDHCFGETYESEAEECIRLGAQAALEWALEQEITGECISITKRYVMEAQPLKDCEIWKDEEDDDEL